MTGPPQIGVRFFRLSEPLAPYFTALYVAGVESGDGLVEDWLHPEGATLRFAEGPPPLARIGAGEPVEQSQFLATGPTSLAMHFVVRSGRIWGLGLQPTGWAKFVLGEASDFANLNSDGSTHPAFALFADLLPQLLASSSDDDDKARMIEAHLMRHIDRATPREAEIAACQRLLSDPSIGEVSVLQDALGMSSKAIERFCCRYFGFTPKVLLRRQRFVRSLAKYMRDPTLSWIDALDGQYHDQAQFVREFRSFMGMTPSEYAAMPHPVLEPALRQRIPLPPMAHTAIADLPTIARYS